MLQQVAGLSQSGKPHPPSACEDENTQRRALVRRKVASSKYKCIKNQAACTNMHQLSINTGQEHFSKSGKL